jgi:hypothetical protein
MAGLDGVRLEGGGLWFTDARRTLGTLYPSGQTLVAQDPHTAPPDLAGVERTKP